jgi:hypothetical protein
VLRSLEGIGRRSGRLWGDPRMNMKRSRLLQSWFRDALAGDVVIDPHDINREAIENLRFFALSGGPSTPDVVAVEAFVSNVVEARAEHLRTRKSRNMTMYWWHDVQAGHLRCSFVSTSHRRLPFGARVRRTGSVRLIVEEWLGSPWLKGIPFDQLTCSSFDEPEPPRQTVRIWSTVLRSGPHGP